MKPPEFVPFQKIPRLARECVITEKIDGTNGVIWISDDLEQVVAGSRNRWLVNGAENYGFARWAAENQNELRKLGPGLHYGEWWGVGIQRGYGLKEKRFSLFNTSRWTPENVLTCCGVVPVICVCNFTDVGSAVRGALARLQDNGSIAAPGFMKPEGVVVYHTAGNVLFKMTLDNDGERKSALR